MSSSELVLKVFCSEHRRELVNIRWDGTGNVADCPGSIPPHLCPEFDWRSGRHLKLVKQDPLFQALPLLPCLGECAGQRPALNVTDWGYTCAACGWQRDFTDSAADE